MSENRQNKPNILKLGLFLALLGAISAGLLAFVDSLTKGPIKVAELKKTTKAIQDVLPPFDNVPADDKIVIKAENGTSVTFYRAKKEGKIIGVAGEGYSTTGFNGKVVVMVGMEPTGKISIVTVTKQHETPGLGTVVTDRKSEKTIFDLFGKKKEESGLPPNRILDAFSGHTVKLESPVWKVKKDGGDFEFVTGATITSRAVTGAVYTVNKTFIENKNQILEIKGQKKSE